jgi:hypothetical protein
LITHGRPIVSLIAATEYVEHVISSLFRNADSVSILHHRNDMETQGGKHLSDQHTEHVAD